MPPPADWQLPPGVSRPLWDYLHSPLVARGYDASMAGHPLFEADQAFVERHCPRPGWLLDLGCGTGRLLVPFARRGYQVLGVDLSSEMLMVARERAAQEGLALDLVQANLAELLFLKADSFDYAACLFSTLGMVVGAEMRRRVLAQALRLLRPGGVFVVHAHNYWFNVHDSGGRRWLLRDLLGWRSWEPGDRPMPPHQGVSGLTLHHFSRREITQLLTEAGFRLLEVQAIDAQARPLRGSWPLDLRAYGYLIAAQRSSLP